MERAEEHGRQAHGVDAVGHVQAEVVHDGVEEAQGEDDGVVRDDGSGRGQVFGGGHEGEQHLVVAALMERVIRQ